MNYFESLMEKWKQLERCKKINYKTNATIFV